MSRSYGYNDPELVDQQPWTWKKSVALFFALLLIFGVWFLLDYKLLAGSDWISPTYDNEDWRTNEGNLHTFGAWDIESHIWKTEYIMENFPNFQWNPNWYMGMPLLKYYQYGFYIVTAGLALLAGISAARSALLLVVFGHLLATLLTFLLAYKLSRRVFASAIASLFVLANTFISLRSYGWEPITVVFLFLYPLGLLFFLREPLRPFRLSIILTMAIAYYSHPLLFFALAMTMGLYLVSIAVRRKDDEADKRHYIWQYLGMVLVSIGIGAVQFILQMSYHQVTSGAHMGVKYLPYYQVPFNIITFKDFLFDAGNLKGPGLVIMISMVLLVVFALYAWRSRSKRPIRSMGRHELVGGLAFVLGMMVLFYYLELWNVFPMNLLRSIQYHRIIPEFVVTAVALVAVMANLISTKWQKVTYYSILIAFALASMLVVWNVQGFWETTPSISDNPEFLEPFEGRMSHPYTDQSLSVRNSFTGQPQVYGYYEQGITNPYADEMFSVSSGYHNAELTIIYLKAANVHRLYTNNLEGKRDAIVRARMENAMEYSSVEGRYGYFEIPLADPSMAQAVDLDGAREVQLMEPGCREMFTDTYCGSVGEEFVTRDPDEAAYLQSYNRLLERGHVASAAFEMVNPDHYAVHVSGATADTAVVVKMTHDDDFTATVGGREVPIERVGPHYMLIAPGVAGDYTISLEYHTPKEALIGLAVSVVTLLLTILYFALGRPDLRPKRLQFPEGDMK